jgi:hypothetical protein
MHAEMLIRFLLLVGWLKCAAEAILHREGSPDALADSEPDI